MTCNPCATESTYALIDCCVANCVAELLAILSSSKIAVPDTPVFNTALVIVLLVSSCVSVKVATVELIFKVTVPDVPPPVKPVPAVTPSISPLPPPPPPRPLVNVYSTIDSPETSDILPLTKLELNVYTEFVVSV